MGKHKREDKEKFHAIAVSDALHELADVFDRAGSRPDGVEIQVTVRGAKTETANFSVDDLSELIALIKLNAGGK